MVVAERLPFSYSSHQVTDTSISRNRHPETVTLSPAEHHEVTPGRPPIVAYLRRSKQEDAMLEETFGGDYREYKDRTGILFPKV